MSSERSEWGAAMLGELATLQQPLARWRFALSCVGVALFTPRREGDLMSDRMTHWRATLGVAAQFSLLIVGVLMFASLLNPPEIPPGTSSSFWQDFFRNWLFLTLLCAPIVNGLRAGERMSMRQWLAIFGAAALFGLLLVGPFAFMEYWNNPRIQSGEFQFPFALFGGLWLLPTMFFLTAIPIVRRLRAGELIFSSPIAMLLRVGFLVLLAVIWAGLIRDQMPCFLGGVPGCD